LKIQALWHINPVSSDILRSEPEIQKNQCLLQSKYSLISVGTERTVSMGKVPVDLHDSMAVPYMKGAFSFPVKYGYSLVGKVLKGPSEWMGRNVHLMHPHQDYCYSNLSDLFILPPTIPLKRATLISNMETAVNAIWDSQVSIGDRVVVVGFGLIGSLVALIVRQIPGVEVQVVEIDKSRQQVARSLGFGVSDSCKKNHFDMAFHASGSATGLQNAIDAVGLEGPIIELSWYGNRKVDISLGTTFHSLRKQLISSQVSFIPSTKQSGWDFKRRKKTVLNLLHNPVFDHLLDTEVPFKESPSVFEKIRNNDWEPLTCVVKY